MLNIPKTIAETLDWKKGDFIKMTVPKAGILQLEKVELEIEGEEKPLDVEPKKDIQTKIKIV